MSGNRYGSVSIDTSGFDRLLKDLQKAGGDLHQTVTKALRTVSSDVIRDTAAATIKPNFPAGGKYSQGDTERSMIREPNIEWTGDEASAKLGFDFSKGGHAGFLIAGRQPTAISGLMPRVNALYRIYGKATGKNSYFKGVKSKVEDIILLEIRKAMSGK